MFKKVICLALALVMVAGMAAIGVSAATDGVAATGADTKFYFEVPSNWGNFTNVFCHLWLYGGDSLASWQSKKEKCTLESDGRYSYDTTKVSLESGSYYGIIFSLDTGMQTYDTLCGTACLGDTLYTDGTVYENPQDSSKTALAAFWKNQDRSQYGPIMQITSVGNLIGTCIPVGVSTKDMFNSFLTTWLESARTYSGKQDQAIIDDIANGLGISQDTVETLIKESKLDIAWEKAKSVAPTKDQDIITPRVPGAVSSGQETTIVYIAVAMMIMAVGVVFFARRRKEAE